MTRVDLHNRRTWISCRGLDPECGPLFLQFDLSHDGRRPVTPGSSPAFAEVAALVAKP
ncbi:hypothetical protein [Azospirillum thiophilum]|uniref:hypothetical protein n=1 Tax=Azospirillum thiophilum TaxID=528244 RepID=UPI000A678F4D|nr:hypothetical protein [Azospirillum thiophilum]